MAQPGGIPAEKHRLLGGTVTVQLLGVSSNPGRFTRVGIAAVNPIILKDAPMGFGAVYDLSGAQVFQNIDKELMKEHTNYLRSKSRSYAIVPVDVHSRKLRNERSR